LVTNVLIIIVSVSGAIVFLYGVSRTSPAHSRKESNDFTGAVVAVIGTTYAVLLAFMLSNVWNMFQQAEINAEQEANDVVNVFRLASLLQGPAHDDVQSLARQYAQRVVAVEFPSMEQDKLTLFDPSLVPQIWKVVGMVQPHSDAESQTVGELMTTLRSLTEHRRIRVLQSHEALPAMLWTVLIAGGVITVAAFCFFGVQNFRFHLLQVTVLTFLISLILVAIADVDRPYQGNVKVSPAGFDFALHTFAREPQ
jgi:hypothetical protein